MKLIPALLSMFIAQIAFAQSQGSQAPPPNYPPPNYPTANNVPPRQYVPPGPPRPGPVYQQLDPYRTHRGLMGGFGLGVSSLSQNDCENCDSRGGLAIDVQIGGFVSPRLALMYDGNFWGESEENATLIYGVHSFAAQFWMTSKLWLKGGIGISTARLSVETFGERESISESGNGLTLGLGIDLLQNGNFAIDLSGRVNPMEFGDDDTTLTSVSLLIGARWK